MNVLIVALDGVPTEMPDADVLVVAPALNSRLRHWLSDEDDAHPLLAIADALSTFPADEIVIAAGDANRLVDKLATRARMRFALPTSLTTGRADRPYDRRRARHAAILPRRGGGRL